MPGKQIAETLPEYECPQGLCAHQSPPMHFPGILTYLESTISFPSETFPNLFKDERSIFSAHLKGTQKFAVIVSTLQPLGQVHILKNLLRFISYFVTPAKWQRFGLVYRSGQHL